jgi:hypothetical protein
MENTEQIGELTDVALQREKHTVILLLNRRLYHANNSFFSGTDFFPHGLG